MRAAAYRRARPERRRADRARRAARQAEFDSAEVAFLRYQAAPAFAKWTETSLRAYIRHGFAPQADGRVRLRCTPEIESAVLLPIYQAIEQVYDGDARGNPFAWLSEIGCPVRIATAANSWPIYKEMASRAAALLPAASRCSFEGVGHCVAQEAPTLLLQALKTFEADSVDSCDDHTLTKTSSPADRMIGTGPGINPALARSSPWKPNQGSMETCHERIRSRPQ